MLCPPVGALPPRRWSRTPDSQPEGWDGGEAPGEQGSEDKVSEAESETEVMSRRGRMRRMAANRTGHSRKR